MAVTVTDESTLTEAEKRDLKQVREMLESAHPGMAYNAEVVIGGKHVQISSPGRNESDG